MCCGYQQNILSTKKDYFVFIFQKASLTLDTHNCNDLTLDVHSYTEQFTKAVRKWFMVNNTNTYTHISWALRYHSARYDVIVSDEMITHPKNSYEHGFVTCDVSEQLTSKTLSFVIVIMAKKRAAGTLFVIILLSLFGVFVSTIIVSLGNVFEIPFLAFFESGFWLIVAIVAAPIIIVTIWSGRRQQIVRGRLTKCENYLCRLFRSWLVSNTFRVASSRT